MNIKPCPLCGGVYPVKKPDKRNRFGKNCVYAGAGSCSSEEVACLRCHLRVVEEHPGRWPREFPGKLKGKRALDWLREWCLKRAVERWNALPRDK